MRVCICGDRNWTDQSAIMRELRKFPPGTIVIEGEARGADSIARDVAYAMQFTVEKYPANWEKYGRAAGPTRNKQMLVDGKPDLVLAFHSDIEKSKGTKNMVMLARKAGIETRVIER